MTNHPPAPEPDAEAIAEIEKRQEARRDWMSGDPPRLMAVWQSIEAYQDVSTLLRIIKSRTQAAEQTAVTESPRREIRVGEYALLANLLKTARDEKETKLLLLQNQMVIGAALFVASRATKAQPAETMLTREEIAQVVASAIDEMTEKALATHGRFDTREMARVAIAAYQPFITGATVKWVPISRIANE